MTFHPRMIRAKEGTSLDGEQIKRIAPSVYAPDKHASRTGVYQFLPTIDVMRHLYREGGFVPVEVSQSKTRDASRREYTKHMVRMRHRDAAFNKVGDACAEIVLINAHDGSSAYKILEGIFRLICSNGMIVSDGTDTGFRVMHKGHLSEEVLKASLVVMQNAINRLEYTERMRAREMRQAEIFEFCRRAAMLRFEADRRIIGGYEALQLPRRAADAGSNDLWHVFNRTQENMMKGGMTLFNPSVQRRRTTHSRPIQGIDQNVKINSELWNLAVEFLED